MFPRIYDDLESYLEPNQVLIIYGPRRSGKTTLLNNFLSKTKLKYKRDSGDDLSVQEILSSQRFSNIIPYVRELSLYVLDEAQHVPEIGMALKIIVDQIPNIKVVVTGSSSLDLRGQIGEPLVGRSQEVYLFPLSQKELLLQQTRADLRHQFLPEILIYGSYPEIISQKTAKNKQKKVVNIVNSYLLKDILEFEQVKDSKTIRNLLKLIAFQVGSEVSLSELGAQVGLDYKTVARYLDLLEKSFVLYNLTGYSRNLRKEITKKSKYYFLDNGIRNAIINNFNDLETRNDVGALWENFLVTERLKKQHHQPIYANNYFWRTWEQKEIDWIEERDGKLFGFEFKWGKNAKYKKPQEFLTTYPQGSIDIVTQENYLDFVT